MMREACVLNGRHGPARRIWARLWHEDFLPIIPNSVWQVALPDDGHDALGALRALGRASLEMEIPRA
jgi:hypothetical protein